MKTYNGHRSWNQWNASLWLTNNEILDSMMRNYTGVKCYSQTRIVNILSQDMLNSKTPDGAIINKTAIRNYVRGYYEDTNMGTGR